MKTRVRSASVFVNCFRVFGYPGGTRARVVYMTSQITTNAVARKVYILVVVLILRSVYLVDVILHLL